jgi:sulfatase maturation enzyme AslB (radical SAM superfamily)
MRLTTAGIASSFRKAVVGRVTRQQLPVDMRAHKIFVTDETPSDGAALVGYSGFLTTAKIEQQVSSVPTISSVRQIEHLRPNDIVAMEPRNGFIRTLYRPDSHHNVIFATERCNSNCLMCSQPPQDRDDTGALTERNLKLIELIDDPPTRLVITGGEPTLLGERLFRIIEALRKKSHRPICTCSQTAAFSPGLLSRRGWRH